MNKQELNQKILKVAEETGKTKEYVMQKLLSGDFWMHFLLKNA